MIYFLLVACAILKLQPAVEWTVPSNVKMVGMLGMNGEQISWGQLEINAGRQGGKDCIALLSMKTSKLLKDCSGCVSASKMVFTDDISNTISDVCKPSLGILSDAGGKSWSLGYDENGQILEFRDGEWNVLSTQSEEQMGMKIFQIR